MKKRERAIVIHQSEELRSYSSALLSDLGFRHVLTAPTLAQAKLACELASQKGHTIQLMICDDSSPEGALAVHRELPQWPCLVITDANNPNNTRLAAALGVNRLVFRPYGKSHLNQILESL